MASTKLDFWLPAWFNWGISHRFSLCILEVRYSLEKLPPTTMWSSMDWHSWDWRGRLSPVLCRSWTSLIFSELLVPHLWNKELFSSDPYWHFPVLKCLWLTNSGNCLSVNVLTLTIQCRVFISTNISLKSFVDQVLRKSKCRIKSLYRIAHILK